MKGFVLRYHFLEAADLAAIVELHAALEVSLAGVQSRALYRALCRDALRGGQVVCLVAAADGQVAGFVTALIHAAAYWKRFARRRPLLALRILAGRLFRRKTARRGAASPAAPASWAESSERIAKIQFIGVAKEFRGRGIGVELYRRLAAHLRERGLERIDARVAGDNTASLRMHRAAG
jgi:ribosomal protein S18 acetylase RimI-like enzyme